MEILLNALVATSVLGLVAVGLYIVYGLMGVINMAHGEMMTIGAYAMVVLGAGGVNFWLAVVVAVAVVAVVGLVLELTVVRFLYGVGGLSTLLATWGVSIAIQQGLQLRFGPSGQYIDAPIAQTTDLLGFSYPVYRLVLLGLSMIVLTGVILIIKKTRIGLLVRATMDGREKAEAMGINTRLLYLVAFVAGSGLAGLAGALIAPLASVTPLMGLDYVVQAFLVVMLGGIESVFAPIAGAAVIGGVASLMTNVSGATIAQILVLGLVVVGVYFRPNGLFGKARQ